VQHFLTPLKIVAGLKYLRVPVKFKIGRRSYGSIKDRSRQDRYKMYKLRRVRQRDRSEGGRGDVNDTEQDRMNRGSGREGGRSRKRTLVNLSEVIEVCCD
jgi:hypothetical protein